MPSGYIHWVNFRIWKVAVRQMTAQNQMFDEQISCDNFRPRSSGSGNVTDIGADGVRYHVILKYKCSLLYTLACHCQCVLWSHALTMSSSSIWLVCYVLVHLCSTLPNCVSKWLVGLGFISIGVLLGQWNICALYWPIRLAHWLCLHQPNRGGRTWCNNTSTEISMLWQDSEDNNINTSYKRQRHS